MKFFVFILSFYMLALNCFPCGDSTECDTKELQKISAPTHHKDHPHETEACAPFCSCACCGAAVFYQPVINAKTITLVFSQRVFHYKNDFNSYDFQSVWQPPKIS